MNREQAEKLLAALIFDDLDETSKAELMAYLQTDDELRDRLADLRMAVKLADDAVNEGPDPVLHERRLNQLRRLAKTGKAQTQVFSIRRMLAAAAVLAFTLVLVGLLVPSLGRRGAVHWGEVAASKAPRSSSRAYSPPPPPPDLSVLRRRIDPAAQSHGQSYGRDAQPEGYAMGGMGGPARDRKDNYTAGTMVSGMGDNGRQMAGKEVASASESLGKSSGVRAGEEIANRQAAASDESWAWPAEAPTIANMPTTISPRGGSAPEAREQMEAKEINGDVAAREARLKEVLGQRRTVAETDQIRGQASSFRSGRGSVAAEVPATTSGGGVYSDKVSFGWSGKVTPEKSGVPMVTPAPSGSAVAFDEELNRGLGINGSVKDDKSAPLPGEVPLAGELFRKGVQPTANTAGPGQAIGGTTASADVSSVRGRDEPPVQATSLPDFAAEAKAKAEQKRVDAAKAQSELRSPAERDRQGRIKELMERAKAYWKQQQYEASQGQLEALLAIDPLSDEALTLKQMAQDMVLLRKQLEIDQLSAKQRVEMLQGADEAGVPYADEITYPKDWREVIQRPTRKPDPTFQLEPANAEVYKQLDMVVDLSQLTAQTPVSTAIDMLRRSVDPPLNIVVNWRDLETNVNIQAASPVQMDGSPKMRLGTALDNLVKAISDPTFPDYPVEYRVNKGVVTIAATPSERSGGAAAVQEDPRNARGQLLSEDADSLPLASHFKVVPVNPWVMAERDAFSTFGLDVDTASYDLCWRYIRGGFLPPVGAVRMEEFVNAFDYAYPQRDDATFAVHAEGAPSPFAPAGQNLALLKVAVKARTVGRDQRRATNLIFVVDASASMGQADRLPLVQSVANRLVDKLADVDRVSLITCANEARLHLEAVPAGQKDAIQQTINAIQPAGPTNLLAGLKLGYEMARKSFVAGQTNQVVLCSDGVANVGQTEAEAMLKEVAEDRKQAITLTCVGVGYGAYNDAFLEALADQADGRYVFLDSSEQAQEALVEQLAGSLQNVAMDARIQVQFNPNQVRRYRLIGYENRDIEDQRFRDDTVEAGAVGSGQCSTALYELELTTSSGMGLGSPTQDSALGVPFQPMNHRQDADATESRGQDARDTDDADLGTVFVRYRNTDTGQIEEISRPLAKSLIRLRSVEDDPRFFLAAGAARFAEWLRQSEHARQTSLSDVQRLLDRVSAALPLDRQVQDLALLARQAEGLPRAPEAPEVKP